MTALMATVAAPVVAEGNLGGKARVNKSTTLQSLSEQMASASCRFNAGIDVQSAQEQLASSQTQFQTILAALESGDTALGIPTAETRSQTIIALNHINETFAPIDSAVQALLSEGSNADDAALIVDARAKLFDETFVLASQVSGQYSDPLELLQADAITLDFAGRQRTMAHSIARLICELEAGIGSDDTMAELERTAQLIENTLSALRTGNEAAGISEPRTPAVEASLDVAYQHWTEKRSVIDGILAGNAATQDNVTQAAEFAASFNVIMDNVITLYLIASPGEEDVYRLPLEAYARSELTEWLTDADLLAALRAQNVAHTDLTEDQIIALDQEWRAEAGAGGGALISKLMDQPVSAWLRDKQTATTGFVTEVFVMDNKGLNVAQSVETSDYWQGDEAKWQETYLISADALHISDIEFDDSTGYYQAQASLPISDPETGGLLGAITFGINVQSLM
jgi:hypothetical protein